jgi:hypothetical protein
MTLPARARIALPLALLAMAVVGAACGSGDKKAATATADLSQATSAAGTRSAGAPSAQATTGKTPTRAAGTTTTQATTTPKAGATSSAVNALDSYHYVVNIKFELSGSESGVQGTIEGDYVGPDSHSFTQTFDVGGIQGKESTVIIGDDAWIMGTGDTDWRATTADDPDVSGSLDLTSADPTFFADQSFVDDISAFDSKSESVDGRDARRYDFDRDQFAKLGDAFGSDIISQSDLAGITAFTMSVWVDDETNTLIRAELNASGPAEELLKDSPISSNPGDVASITLNFHITQVNDKSIKIDPPV